MPDDPRYTAKLRLIDLHYEKQGEDLTWRTWRYNRLASALRLTVHELGAFIRIRPHQVDKYLEQDRFPPTVELHLTLIERSLFPSAQPPVFPALPCSSTTTS